MVVFAMPLRFADTKEIATLFRGFFQRTEVAGQCGVSCAVLNQMSETEGKFYAGS
jgi:hypothetical protein